jgi:CPA1 family monovalent cation:H+ antiporter
MEHVDVVTLGLLLFIACLVAIVTRRIGLPYAIGLVVAGIGLSLFGYKSRIELTPELIFTFLLPPLVFEAALHLGWDQFRREAPLVLSIAFVGTLLSAFVVAGGMHWLLGWGWQASLLFGSLIAATDPVSVIAMMKEQHAEKRLRFLMESESLVNDGAAAVLFSLVVAWIAGKDSNAVTVTLSLLTTVGGGVLCGLVVAAALLAVAGRSDDHLVELTLTVLAAYGSFLIAEKLHVSGVLATLAAGMLVGNWGRGKRLTDYGGEAMIRFWDFAAFLANSVVFLLIGSREAAQPLGVYLIPALIGTALVLAGRAIAVYPITALFNRTVLATSGVTQHILFWGGLRGAFQDRLPAPSPDEDDLFDISEHRSTATRLSCQIPFAAELAGMTVVIAPQD